MITMNYHHEPFVPTYVQIIPQLVRHSGLHRHNHLPWPPSNAKVRCNAAAVPLALPRLPSWGRNCNAWFPKRFASWHNDDSCVISTTSANMDANICKYCPLTMVSTCIIVSSYYKIRCIHTVIFLTVSRAKGNRNWTQWPVRLLMFTLKTRDFGAEQQCSGCFLTKLNNTDRDLRSHYVTTQVLYSSHTLLYKLLDLYTYHVSNYVE